MRSHTRSHISFQCHRSLLENHMRSHMRYHISPRTALQSRCRRQAVHVSLARRGEGPLRGLHTRRVYKHMSSHIRFFSRAGIIGTF